MTVLPPTVSINAWTAGAAAGAPLDAAAGFWGTGGALPHSQQPMAMDPVIDPRNWADPRVGYGVLLLDPGHPAQVADKAAGVQAPPGVQRLLAERPGTVLLYWSPDLGTRFVRRYFADGLVQAPVVGLTKFGVGVGELPRYVLIVGGPDQVPWSVQYALGTRHAVGRLPFTDARLDHYVAALLGGWPDTEVDRAAPLVWAVDGGDITSEMADVVAEPLADALDDPALPGLTFLTAADALGARLVDRLRVARPGLVVTSSHGLTAGAGAVLAAALGQPVDAGSAPVPLGDLDAAMPGGAIWYSYACCSAGSAGPSSYAGLLAPGTAASVVASVAALGSTVSPAPMRLLGRPDPIRGFLGHVEPTFDWTLRVEETGQTLGHEIVAALSTHLFLGGEPLGLVLGAYRASVGVLHGQWADVRQEIADGDVTRRPEAVRLRLAALDRQSLVLLGDPTVPLPPA